MSRYLHLLLFLGCAFLLAQRAIAAPVTADELKKRADAGDVSAMRQFAGALERGEGVSKNVSLAIQYYKKAGSKGDKFACERLASFYETGTNLPQNSRAASYWTEHARGRKTVQTTHKNEETKLIKLTGETAGTETGTGGNSASEAASSDAAPPPMFAPVEELVKAYDDIKLPQVSEHQSKASPADTTLEKTLGEAVQALEKKPEAPTVEKKSEAPAVENVAAEVAPEAEKQNQADYEALQGILKQKEAEQPKAKMMLSPIRIVEAVLLVVFFAALGYLLFEMFKKEEAVQESDWYSQL